MAAKTVLVIGGAGKTGQAIVGEALKRGYIVRALVRDQAKAAMVLPGSVGVVQGDGRDAATVGTAIEGADVVVIPAGGRTAPVSAEIVRTAINAMKERGPRRLIAVSAYGAVDSRGFYGWVMRTLAKAVSADKIAMERALGESGLEWTAVRPGILNDAAAKGAKVIESGVMRGMPSIPRADVATFILDEIETPRFAGRAVTIGA